MIRRIDRIKPPNQRAVSSEQHCCRLASDPERLPRLERLIPQHRERLGSELLDKVFGLAEAVLSSETDDFDFLAMITSELLEVSSGAEALK